LQVQITGRLPAFQYFRRLCDIVEVDLSGGRRAERFRAHAVRKLLPETNCRPQSGVLDRQSCSCDSALFFCFHVVALIFYSLPRCAFCCSTSARGLFFFGKISVVRGPGLNIRLRRPHPAHGARIPAPRHYANPLAKNITQGHVSIDIAASPTTTTFPIRTAVIVIENVYNGDQ